MATRVGGGQQPGPPPVGGGGLPEYQHPAKVFRALVAEECPRALAGELERHFSLLVNMTEAALLNPAGEAAVRDFLAFLARLHGRFDEERSARSYAEWHCEALRRQLHAEREGRNADGFRLAAGAIDHVQALEAERELRYGLEAQLRTLESRLQYSCCQQERQAMELQMLTQGFAVAEVGMEDRLRQEVLRQQALNKEGYDQALEELRTKYEAQVLQARAAEERLRDLAEQERAAAAACRNEWSRLDAAMEPWRVLQAANLASVLQLARWLQDEAPRIKAHALPARFRIPVMALEWPPHTPLDTELVWSSVSTGGLYALVHGLLTGEMPPEAMELTACCVEGRWIGALHGDSEAPRLAALQLLQALRPDVLVLVPCRVVPMKRALLPKGVLELDPGRRSTAPVGSDHVRRPSAGPAWQVGLHPRPPPLSTKDADEVLLRGLIRGSPLERELLSALGYVRAAHPEALARAPAGVGGPQPVAIAA